MKNGWKEKSVGGILQLEYGKPLDDADRKPNGRFPVYGANGEKNRTDRFYHDKPSIVVGRKGSAGELNFTEEKFWPLDVTYFVTFSDREYDLQFLVLDKGDLLVAMTEQAAGLLGSPIIVPKSNKFLHNQRLGLVMKKPGVPWTNDFFFHVFNTHRVRKEIHASASGVKVRHTSPTKIGEVVVAFPGSTDEQRKIVAALETVSAETQRLASLYQRKLAALAALKKSLLHQAFTGQL